MVVAIQSWKVVDSTRKDLEKELEALCNAGYFVRQIFDLGMSQEAMDGKRFCITAEKCPPINMLEK